MFRSLLHDLHRRVPRRGAPHGARGATPRTSRPGPSPWSSALCGRLGPDPAPRHPVPLVRAAPFRALARAGPRRGPFQGGRAGRRGALPGARRPGGASSGWLFARALYKDGRSPVPERLKARFLARLDGGLRQVLRGRAVRLPPCAARHPAGRLALLLRQAGHRRPGGARRCPGPASSPASTAPSTGTWWTARSMPWPTAPLFSAARCGASRPATSRPTSTALWAATLVVVLLNFLLR